MASCGGSGDGDCDLTPEGLFEIRYTERSGDCRLGSWTTIQRVGDEEGCTASAVLSEDECSEESDVVCTFDDGTSSRAVGKYFGDDNGFSGRVEITFFDAAGRFDCRGIYEVDAKKL